MMKGEMIFAIFLMIVAGLSGILAGTAIQATAVEKSSSGATWTSLIVGIALAIMTCVMSSHALSIQC